MRCQQKGLLAKLPLELQYEKQVARAKYTPHHLTSADAHALNDKLKDAVVFDVHTRLERGENDTSCFLALYKVAREGKLTQHQTFVDLCAVFEDRIQRFSDQNNPNLKYGVRLSEPVPPTNSDMSGDKCEGLSMTGRGDAEVLRTLASAYVLHPCDTCVLLFRRT